jgi:phosphoribosylamine--glycine ligase
MRVLVVGSGAREHALCARIAASPLVRAVLCAPGNAGIADAFAVRPIAADDLDGLVALCLAERVDLVVPGPEAPLVAGLADRLLDANIPCFGPVAAAARLEGSKGFSKDFMARHQIPTAAYARFDELARAEDYVRAVGHRVVVKADGLAAGKGVTVCDDVDQALDALTRTLRDGAFGDAGRSVVVEERLEGPEVSLHVICDGERYAVLGVAQDHKRLGDGDTGPNTGGMGAYSPVPAWTPALEARAIREVVEPTLRGIAREGSPFRGVLFVGLMLTPDGPRVLEYNVRFGDPECAVLLARIDGDIVPWLLGCAKGALDASTVRHRDVAAVGVVIAAEGYPDAPRRGAPVSGLDRAAQTPGVQVLHAGTRRDGTRWVTAGGRVLLLVAAAPTFREARASAYAAVDAVELPGAQVRRDIGWRAARDP